MDVELSGYAAFEGELIADLVPHIDRALGASRPRTPRARRTLDGRRPVAELRPRRHRHVCLGGRLLVGAEHDAAGAAAQGPGCRPPAPQAAVGVARDISETVHNVPRVEEQPLSPVDAVVPLRRYRSGAAFVNCEPRTDSSVGESLGRAHATVTTPEHSARCSFLEEPD
jgi:hypothetical protein